MKTIRLVALCGVSLFALSACGPTFMAVPADVAKSTTVLTATDRSRATGMLVNEGFKLAPYTVTDVSRDAVSTTGFQIAGHGTSGSKTGLQWKVKDKAGVWTGQCAIRSRTRTHGFAGGMSVGNARYMVYCQCKGPGPAGTIDMKASGDRYMGKLFIDRKPYNLESLHKLAGGFPQAMPTGYRIDETTDKGVSVFAAVEATHPGRVFLGKGMAAAERGPAVCLAAGLMLYREPSANQQ